MHHLEGHHHHDQRVWMSYDEDDDGDDDDWCLVARQHAPTYRALKTPKRIYVDTWPFPPVEYCVGLKAGCKSLYTTQPKRLPTLR